VPPDEVHTDKADDVRRLERGVATGSRALLSAAAVAKFEKDSIVRDLGDDMPPLDEVRLMLL
jgi:hypothetical protein